MTKVKTTIAILLGILLGLVVHAHPAHAQAPTDSALSRSIQRDVDSVSLNPRLNSRSKRALLRIDARADSITHNPRDSAIVVRVDTVLRVDTVYATRPDTTHPPVDSIPTKPPNPPAVWTHPYPPLPNGTAYAELPRDSVSIAVPAPTRTVRVVSLQAALDTAQTGDRLLIPPRAVADNLMVKFTPRTSWVTVQGTDSTSVIRGTVGGATSAISIMSKAHHVQFLGPLTITMAVNANAVVRSFNGERDTSQVPHHIILNGVTIVVPDTLEANRCVWPDGAYMAVVNSILKGCATKGGDAQGILIGNGPGPYRFENNYIEASHQCFMSGGFDAGIPGIFASDVYFGHNTCFKPAYWHFTTPGIYVGKQRQTKTIVETKFIRRFLLEYNILHVSYADAQAGFCGLFKSENQGNTPIAQTADVTARYNRCRNVASGFNIAAHPGSLPSVPLQRFTGYGNQLDTLSTRGGEGICFQLLDDVRDVALMHNTCSNATNNAMQFDGAPGIRTAIVGNVIANGQYGVKGGSTGIGTPTINKWILPSGLWASNAIVGADCNQYPPGTICTLTVPLPVAPDGTPIGADPAKLP